MFVPYINNKKWGKEDDLIFEYNNNKGFAIRKYYGDEFIHQWHPHDMAFLNRYYEQKI
jgi:hypothetical protein